MGVLADHIHRRVGEDLDDRHVVVWYDPARAWESWIRSLVGGAAPSLGPQVVLIDGRDAKLVTYQGSYYELLRACEPLTSGTDLPRLLVYVPGEEHQEALTPLRELECVGGEKEPYQDQRDLASMARRALSAAGTAESEIDALLAHENLDFEYLDRLGGDSGSASPLSPVFGSGREIDVFPLFLVDERRRTNSAKKGLLPDIAMLARSSLGLAVEQKLHPSAMRDQLARMILCAEFRADLKGPAPSEISLILAPSTDDQRKRARSICERLRKDFPEEYETLARNVERELGLATAEIDPLALGEIDTFPFEEARLLDACDRLLVSGHALKALPIVEARKNSFWISIARHPDRHRMWQGCHALALLSFILEEARAPVKQASSRPEAWITAYTAANGWHLVDRLFREARHHASTMIDVAVLERARAKIFADYTALVDVMTTRFVGALRETGFHVPGVLSQTEIFAKLVQRQNGATAYFLVDSLRFEMGKQLAEMLESQGASGVALEPALAAVPTITPVGMTALLPGADRSFSVRESAKGICGAIGGRPLDGIDARMDYAKAQVPGLVELPLDMLSELTPKQLAKRLQDATCIVVRSIEIDSAGESLPNQLAQVVMGTVLENLRNGIARLSAAGVSKFVVTADHGHLFGSRLGDEMKIDVPGGGTQVDLHRRCWVGRGGDTPSGCLRVPGRDLGYDTDLEFVFPKGLGVFKAGGDLAYHHGGLSLQELVIPVLSFELKASAQSSTKLERVALSGVPKTITNRIFSVAVASVELMLEPLELRVIAVATVDNRTVGQAVFADIGWDADKRLIVLLGAQKASIGLQLEDDSVKELRIVVIEHRTGRVLKDTSPIPVDVMR